MIVDSTQESFASDFKEEGLSIVDFWAEWCAPCRSFAPIFAQSAQERPEIAHLKVNVDEELNLARFFEITSIPTTVFIRDGYLLDSITGAISKSRLDDLITQSYNLDMEMVKKEGKLIKELLRS